MKTCDVYPQFHVTLYAYVDLKISTITEMLAQATLLGHPKSDAPTSILTDASDTAVGTVLQQYLNLNVTIVSGYLI